MKKPFIAIILSSLIIPVVISAQDVKIVSNNLDEQGRAYDRQIFELNKKIQEMISNSSLMTNKTIRALPYQTEIKFGPDRDNPKYVEIIKHIYIKNNLYSTEIVGVEEKSFKIYSDGKTVTMTETSVRTKNYKTDEEEIVTVTDPSPLTESTDDVVMTHVQSGKKIVDHKKLGDVENTPEAPLRNTLKNQFIISDLSIIYKNMMFIIEYNKKDYRGADKNMSDFLIKSTLY